MKAAAREQRKISTKSEALLWRALRDRRLDGWKFRRQQAVGPFIVDFYCHERSLAVEVDRPIHDRQVAADEERQRAVESLGIRFVRVTAEQVENELPFALQTIRAALDLPSPSGRGAAGEGRTD